MVEALREAGHDPALNVMGDRGVAGPANPTAVEIETRVEGDEAVADVVFGAAFEGAPGRVHGGMVAAVFDDILGMAMSNANSPGFTGRLTVHYRAPVPVGERIEFRARGEDVDGRKLKVLAEARLGDRVLAEGEALFILVDREHFATTAQELLAGDGDG
jgi:acyl-coenzyme A thioesterase PaaI-like protein